MGATKVTAIANGAKFCECGGMMVHKDGSPLLMSDPPQVEICCRFCGHSEYVTAPYNVEVQFKKQD